MACYVDKLVDWGSAWLETRGGKKRSASCHLVADTLDELHAMAKRIGLRREWFQDAKSVKHYDLTPRRRAAAVAAGAIELSRVEFVNLCRRQRGQAPIATPEVKP